MVLSGHYTVGKTTYGAFAEFSKETGYMEVMLSLDNVICSAYKMENNSEYCFNSMEAKTLGSKILSASKGCSEKNAKCGFTFALGVGTQYEFIKLKAEYTVQFLGKELAGLVFQTDIPGKEANAMLIYNGDMVLPKNVQYVKLASSEMNASSSEEVVIRTIEEIALTKESVEWLKDKNYYIINDDATAEQIFDKLDNYTGPIAYDTETTGLFINCFGQIGSDYKKSLEEFNRQHPDDQIRADKLVGIIFCVEEGTSYYFPATNRKFKNLYQEGATRDAAIQALKVKYTIGELREADTPIANYIRESKAEDITPDIILMERVRKILERGHIVAHNGAFEWKVGWQYSIDTNLKDDTMLLHQVMFKFRSTTSNRGEPSNLKYLSKRELGIDQWELGDFFPSFKPNKKGHVRGFDWSKTIDFSYMDYDGTRVYAPTDGDATLGLYNLYKPQLINEHSEQVYLYSFEIIVACAIGYMEFYGHRINEDEVLGVRDLSKVNLVLIESRMRQVANYASAKELELFAQCETEYNRLSKMEYNDIKEELLPALLVLSQELRGEQNLETGKLINFSAPGQVANLVFNELGVENPDGSMSIAKKVQKKLLKLKDENGNAKYPIIELYSKYKALSTLITKFFDNLPYFMYPGGFIFSSFGQYSTATGRMSCLDEHTKISVVGGDKEIKDVKVGDEVYCYDDAGNLRIKQVSNVIDNGYKECINLEWESQGTHTRGNLICTPEHKIRSKNNGWITAESLKQGDKVFHLRRSAEDRPRLFGANGYSEQEQLFIKREYFNSVGYDEVIHHKNGKTKDNSIENLEIMQRSDHSKMHTEELLRQGRIKYAHLQDYKPPVKKGKEHHNYIDKSAEELIDMLMDSDGKMTQVDMDFSTFKNKCDKAGIDYKFIKQRLNPRLRDVSPEEFKASYDRNNGTVFAIANELNIGRTHVENLIKDYGFSRITLGMEIDTEEFSKYFMIVCGDYKKLSCKFSITIREAQRICKELNLSYIGISDGQFIEIYMNNKGSIRATAEQLGITFYKASMTVKRLNLCYNHTIIGHSKAGIRHVYDLEVEDCHNFIANEICVHNCSKPNAQQYPKAITNIVEPRQGYCMADADYSQIEYRVLTALAGNEYLAELFKDPDSDYHTLMAAMMYDVPYASVTPKMRSDAKSFNFGIPYGMGFKSLALLLTGNNGKLQVQEAKEKYEAYFKNQPKTKQFFDDVKEMAVVNKYVRTFWSRYRYFSFGDGNSNEDRMKKASALRQAGNTIIQGSAADIFKISVARNFQYIRANGLLGLFLIINMIHDEQLFEINVEKLNLQRVMRDIGFNMQFKVEGFPPLYIGAGVGKAWGKAKGKLAEIHPLLLEEMSKEAENTPIFDDNPKSEDEWIKYFDERVLKFRINKVKDYVLDKSNYGKELHPAVGNLLNLQFTYGLDKDKDLKADGTSYNDQEFTEECLKRFIEHFNLGLDPELFKVGVVEQEKEEDTEYSDDEDEEFDEFDEIEGLEEAKFEILEDSNVFGVKINDLVRTFGYFVNEKKKMCAVDVTDLPFRDREAIVYYLDKNRCDENDEGAMEINFLLPGNILNNTGVYVKNVTEASIRASSKAKLNKDYEFDDRVK